MGYRKSFYDIIVLVLNNTKRMDNHGYINQYLQDGVAEAVKNHNFRDCIQYATVIGNTGEASVGIKIDTTNGEMIDILSVIATSGSESVEIPLKHRMYLHRRYPNPVEEPAGQPECCYFHNGYLYFSRPLDANYTMTMWYVEIPTVITENSIAVEHCPIPNLDTYLIDYATFRVFESVGEYDKAAYWRVKALGPNYDNGIVGGDLLRAINYDKYKSGEEMKFEEPPNKSRVAGVPINIDGVIKSWY